MFDHTLECVYISKHRENLFALVIYSLVIATGSPTVKRDGRSIICHLTDRQQMLHKIECHRCFTLSILFVVWRGDDLLFSSNLRNTAITHPHIHTSAFRPSCEDLNEAQESTCIIFYWPEFPSGRLWLHSIKVESVTRKEDYRTRRLFLSALTERRRVVLKIVFHPQRLLA